MTSLPKFKTLREVTFLRFLEVVCRAIEVVQLGQRISAMAGVKRLNGVDALMLYIETPEVHMHTLKIGVLDVSGVAGGYDFEVFRPWRFRG